MWPSASEVTLNDIGKIQTKTKPHHNETTRKSCALISGNIVPLSILKSISYEEVLS